MSKEDKPPTPEEIFDYCEATIKKDGKLTLAEAKKCGSEHLERIWPKDKEGKFRPVTKKEFVDYVTGQYEEYEK